jgi:RNA polymerase sigma-70 factor, ECF subfamily
MDDLGFARRCAKGDKQAWDEFITRYSRLIYNYIYSVLDCGGADQTLRASADDIFQEIFVILSKDNFHKLKSYQARSGCTLASWLRVVTVNFTLSYARKFRPAFSLEEREEDENGPKDIAVDPRISAKEKLHAEDTLGHLRDCIGKLDTEDKYFLELHVNRSLGLERLCKLFRLSRGAIDMRKSRIIERLKACFKKKGLLLNLS